MLSMMTMTMTIIVILIVNVIVICWLQGFFYRGRSMPMMIAAWFPPPATLTIRTTEHCFLATLRHT